NACRNVLELVAGRSGSDLVILDIPFPLGSAEDLTRLVVERLNARSRLLLIDHITSQTGLVFPLEQIVGEVQSRGVDVLVDGAHAPGMLPLDLSSLGAAYYTGNLHKWVCAPKGSAFLFAREDRREGIRPIAISHGANSTRTDRSRYLLEFDWTGTFDPTAWLSVPAAIDHLDQVLPGGWDEIMESNRNLALEGRALLCETLGIGDPAPAEMIGSLASVPLPDGRSLTAPSLYGDPLQDALLERFGIEVPVIPWPAPPHRLLRISAQIYNTIDEYRFLADCLRLLLDEERSGR
ncbi:MAG TPA: aminotransferase class V-fold PLP-dependent enzyme, partial [Thermoanaerobaculia bacterium]|nr:aminotransferase class V-fold PLP-dependent enzyme [Thermoanaerobaculia bacterium]